MVLNKKYKGNTLPEVLIALVIISFTSVLGIVIYLNIQKSTQPFVKLKAQEVAQCYLLKTQQEKNFISNTENTEEYSISKTITRSELYPDCIIMTIKVSNHQQTILAHLNTLIHVVE